MADVPPFELNRRPAYHIVPSSTCHLLSQTRDRRLPAISIHVTSDRLRDAASSPSTFLAVASATNHHSPSLCLHPLPPSTVVEVEDFIGSGRLPLVDSPHSSPFRPLRALPTSRTSSPILEEHSLPRTEQSRCKRVDLIESTSDRAGTCRHRSRCFGEIQWGRQLKRANKQAFPFNCEAKRGIVPGQSASAVPSIKIGANDKQAV